MKTAIYWFRNDLRLRDNEGLTQAIEANDQVLPVYIFDEAQFKETHYGFPKTGLFRTRFLIESVEALREQLRKIDGELVVRVGHPAEELAKLQDEFDAPDVFCTKEYTREELDAEDAIEGLRPVHGLTLFHPDDIPFDIEEIPDVFTAFRKKCEKLTKVREEFAVPKVINTPDVSAPGDLPSPETFGFTELAVDSRAVLTFKGGEAEAWKRLHHYFWDTHCLAEYKQTRNGLIGADYSSKFSPWLANGSISPRSIYWQISRFEAEVKKNQDTYWLLFELIWRDYFKFIAMKYGNRLFYREGIKQLPVNMTANRSAFEKWMQGETPQPFVNANMIELAATGFMSNRGRQNVASFLTKDFKVDWRLGAAWFESMLIDYDPASNYGNWQYVAGVGNDPRENRYFNIITQAKHYDPKGTYTNLWNN